MKTISDHARQPCLSPEVAAEVVQLGGTDYGSLQTEKLERVRRLLLDKCKRLEPPYLLIDLSRVDSVGAAFAGVLVEAWDELSKRGRRLALCELTPYCARLIRKLKLDKLLAIYGTQRAALRTIRREVHGAEESDGCAGVRMRESEVAWDPNMVRLEYFDDDDVPIRCVIVPRA